MSILETQFHVWRVVQKQLLPSITLSPKKKSKDQHNFSTGNESTSRVKIICRGSTKLKEDLPSAVMAQPLRNTGSDFTALARLQQILPGPIPSIWTLLSARLELSFENMFVWLVHQWHQPSWSQIHCSPTHCCPHHVILFHIPSVQFGHGCLSPPTFFVYFPGDSLLFVAHDRTLCHLLRRSRRVSLLLKCCGTNLCTYSNVSVRAELGIWRTYFAIASTSSTRLYSARAWRIVYFYTPPPHFRQKIVHVHNHCAVLKGLSFRTAKDLQRDLLLLRALCQSLAAMPARALIDILVIGKKSSPVTVDRARCFQEGGADLVELFQGCITKAQLELAVQNPFIRISFTNCWSTF